MALSGPPAMSALMPLLGVKRTSATSPIEPAPCDLVHPGAARLRRVSGINEGQALGVDGDTNCFAGLIEHHA